MDKGIYIFLGIYSLPWFCRLVLPGWMLSGQLTWIDWTISGSRHKNKGVWDSYLLTGCWECAFAPGLIITGFHFHWLPKNSYKFSSQLPCWGINKFLQKDTSVIFCDLLFLHRLLARHFLSSIGITTWNVTIKSLSSLPPSHFLVPTYSTFLLMWEGQDKHQIKLQITRSLC